MPRKEEELLPKGIWDLLPAYPPYPPLPRAIVEELFGEELGEKGVTDILPEPPWKE